MRSRLEAKVAKYSLLAIFMLLALSAVVVYFGGSNNNRERKQISWIPLIYRYVKCFYLVPPDKLCLLFPLRSSVIGQLVKQP